MTWESDFSEPVSSSSGRLSGSCPSRVLAGLHDKVFVMYLEWMAQAPKNSCFYLLVVYTLLGRTVTSG